MSTREYAVTAETLDSISDLWQRSDDHLQWDCLFVLPPWLKAWWSAFGAESRPWIRAVRREGALIGVAPLMVQGDTARFMGSTDVCDYQDFIVVPGRGREFSHALIADLSEHGIARLDLGAVRPESSVLTDLSGVARERDCKLLREQNGVAVELDLPASWDGFVDHLDKKQRHELRRKFRRLRETAPIDFRGIANETPIHDEIDTFLRLFRANRRDKASFMTDRMASYFRALMEAMAQAGLLNLSFLEIGGVPAAVVLCFEHGSTTYLYNNGYDRSFEKLSVGLLCKALSIKDSIQRGQAKYDFLSGAEPYKHRLGGREVPLYRCLLNLG